MHSLTGNRTQPRPGFPIRTPSDQRFVDNSPRLNAVSHVLHRLSMPRHPPCALEQQTHTRITQHTNNQKTHTNKKQDARVHYTVLTHHTHHHQPATTTSQQPVSQPGTTTHTTRINTRIQCRHHVLPQTPNSAPTINIFCSATTGSCKPTHPPQRIHARGVHPPGFIKNVSSTTHGHSTNTKWAYNCKPHKKLLRKEVIQPHLPVRLPCYDFVPIANPTFDSSLTRLGHWLRVLPTFMT